MLNSLDPDQDRQSVWSLSCSKLFVKVISRQQKLPLAGRELINIWTVQNLVQKRQDIYLLFLKQGQYFNDKILIR